MRSCSAWVVRWCVLRVCLMQRAFFGVVEGEGSRCVVCVDSRVFLPVRCWRGIVGWGGMIFPTPREWEHASCLRAVTCFVVFESVVFFFDVGGVSW